MESDTTTWRDRLSNVPVPEQHVVPLAAAAVAERVVRARLPGRPTVLRTCGVVILLRAATQAWQAWREARAVRLVDPDRLLTTGPYARHRHPMYRAWAIGHLGWALLTRSGWALGAWVPAVLAVHRQVGSEETALRRRFGTAYARYAESVPR